MTDNKYYTWWKEKKPFLSLVPALVFWLVSMIFFMVGLKFENPIIVLGWDAGMTIAISLSLSNTIIQVIGNEEEQEGMGMALWLGWMASYVLGIGTNIAGLNTVLSMENPMLQWSIAVGLGVMIEVLPERLLVQFLKSFNGIGNKPTLNKPNRPKQVNNNNSASRPKQVNNNNKFTRPIQSPITAPTPTYHNLGGGGGVKRPTKGGKSAGEVTMDSFFDDLED